MGLFDQFPYTNFHDLNLDWILEFVKSAGGTVESYEDRLQQVEQSVRSIYITNEQFDQEIHNLKQAVAELYTTNEQFRTAFEQEISRLDQNDTDLRDAYQQLLEQVQTLREVPTGGEAGQVLTADGLGGYTWEDAPPGGPVLVSGGGFSSVAVLGKAIDSTSYGGGISPAGIVGNAEFIPYSEEV